MMEANSSCRMQLIFIARERKIFSNEKNTQLNISFMSTISQKKRFPGV